MDTYNFDYTPLLGFPNLLVSEDKGVNHPTEIHPTLRPLLTKLAKNKPNWRIICIKRLRAIMGSSFVATHFNISEGDENLGSVWRDYTSVGGEVVAMNNPRLSAARQRGEATRTKDMAKAYKIILANFKPKSIAEIAQEAWTEGSNLAFNKANQISGELLGATHNIRDMATAFAVRHWDAFYAEEGTDPAMCAKLDNLIAKQEQAEASREFIALSSSKSMLVVVIHGNDYILLTDKGRRIVPHDQVSNHVRRCVGMLKLVDDKEYIPNVGIRRSATQFVIMPDPETPKEQTNEED